MSAPNTAAVRKTAKPTIERAIAAAGSLAPITTGITMPLLNDSASFLALIGYGGAAALAGANYTGHLPADLSQHLPTDILRAQRVPLGISTLVTGVTMGVTWKGGWQGTDLLMAGITDMPTLKGLVSLTWWAAVAHTPFKLRKVLLSGKRTTTSRKARAATAKKTTGPLTADQRVRKMWAAHISNPAGTNPRQELVLRTHGRHRWTGTITAPTPNPVTVTRETISAVYEKNIEWIDIKDGAHAGEKHITVHLVAPAEHDPSTLPGAWRKYVAKPGGLMPHTHLEDHQPDPNTGGEVARIVADDNFDGALTAPDRRDLVGALRIKNPLLVSYEPLDNPREAYIRRMDRNPLEDGAEFPGIDVLRPNKNGYVRLGRAVSGHPMRLQIFDPKLGAQHIIVTGVTGSGKGGTLQLIALAHHINGSAIIYADPKGSSNPTVAKMAAYSGTGVDGALGALRIWFRILMHRIDESARTETKNFASTPERPWVPLVMDEASKLLGENAPCREEATFIINAGATLGRSMGMPVIGADQLLQLKSWGGDAAIRDNMFYGGSLVLHRADSMQKRLVDLPDNFAGCDPSDIPAAWSGERAMIFDESVPEDDPTRTFGLNFTASAGSAAEMCRTWLLEDALPYVDFNQIAHPADWPLWDERHDLAEQSVLPGAQTEDEDGVFTITSAPATPRQPVVKADQRVKKVLSDSTDPADGSPIPMHKDDIAACTQLEQKTLENTLTKLKKAGEIHQPDDAPRGFWAIGPKPTDTDQEQ
ncbi:hypothetical protein ACFW9D_05515 [Streptomyces sp. NPDC059524]|uniref:type IV secretory system conjugative DNA transfer family protein n=1 Tax=Streptomyces sp. NPDC059524 TaxID=3346856 RepID=UPI00367A28E5